MNVGDLIALLENFNPSAKVVFPTDNARGKEFSDAKEDQIMEIQVKTGKGPHTFVCFDFYDDLILE